MLFIPNLRSSSAMCPSWKSVYTPWRRLLTLKCSGHYTLQMQKALAKCIYLIIINVMHIFVVRDNLLQFWTERHETWWDYEEGGC